MKENFKASLNHVLVHEGGWSDHPQDPGGATMKGVTLATFRRFYGSSKTKQDLRNISDDQLGHIYKTGYWDKCQCDELPCGVDYTVFDAAVNSGPTRSAKWLQAAVGANQDGVIGPVTLGKAFEGVAQAIINRALDRRLSFLKSLSTWPTFGRGWGRRIAGVREVAKEMASAGDWQPPSMDYEIVREGSRGKWVKKLQAVLEVKVDGIFGSKTKAALIAWQIENGLQADGIAGRNTYRVMGLI